MAVPMKMKLHCPKCGWSKTLRVGDALSAQSLEGLRQLDCPRCGTRLERVGMPDAASGGGGWAGLLGKVLRR